MPFDVTRVPRRVAVIGGGISGMAAAHFLHPSETVTLYEAEPRLGGHARTVLAGRSGERPVDTGFIVFNYATYPHLGRLFHELDVPVARSDMSFGVSIDGGRIEYALRSLPALFAQPRNAARPGFLRMLRDIQRFNTAAEAMVDDDPTIGELVGALGLGDWFRRYYLVPDLRRDLVDPGERDRGVPRPHPPALLPQPRAARPDRPAPVVDRRGRQQGVRAPAGVGPRGRRRPDRHRRTGRAAWRGTATASRCTSPADRRSGTTRSCSPATPTRRCAFSNGRPRPRRPRSGAIRYRSNAAVLHRDPRQMPRRRACWSSWVYRADGERTNPGIGVTYWMNRLQNIPDDDPLFVTLNAGDAIPDDLVYDRTELRPPGLRSRRHTGAGRARRAAGRQRHLVRRRLPPPRLPRGRHRQRDAGRPPDAGDGALTAWPEHVPAVTWHGRKGAVRHAFRYSVDYVLIDPEARSGPRLFSRNRMNLASVHDRDHGGAPGHGAGLAWARNGARRGRAAAARRLPHPPPDPAAVPRLRLQPGQLLARPSRRGAGGGHRRGQQHLRRPAQLPLPSPGLRRHRGRGQHDRRPSSCTSRRSWRSRAATTSASTSAPTASRSASPCSGGPEGLVATLTGDRRPLTSGSILVAAVRRPFGALRTIALIHWEALRLTLKGARYRPRPAPPVEEIT